MKMKILHVIEGFSNNYGGPSVSVSELVANSSTFCDAEVLSIARNSAELINSHADDLGVDYSISRDRGFSRFGRVFCLSFTIDLIKKVCSGVDVIHLHSVWSYPTIAIFVLRIFFNFKIILSPRSSLMRLSFKKNAVIKRIFKVFFLDSLMKKTSAIHVTSKSEKEDLLYFYPSADVYQIPNGIDDEPFREFKDVALPEKRVMLFLSRLNERKQPEILIKAFSELVQDTENKNWQLRICGDGDSGYVSKLKQLANDLGLTNDLCVFVGEVRNQEKIREFVTADLFVLPSKFENFGMSIVEALAAGTPTLVTTNSPWQELQVFDCGWQCEMNYNSFVGVLSNAMSLKRSQLKDMGRRGRLLVSNTYTWSGVAEKYKIMYEGL